MTLTTMYLDFFSIFILDDTRSTHSVLRESQRLIAQKYEIHHSTIQVEKFHDQMENCSMCEEPKD